MHVDDLPIAFATTDRCRDDNEGVLVDEISNTSLILGAVAGVRDEVELEGMGKS